MNIRGGTDSSTLPVQEQIARSAIPFTSLGELPLQGLTERIGSARVVMIGEASHGTSEFYEARAMITRYLIEHEGFNFVAIEGDWPDAARVDQYVRHRDIPASEWTTFARFPTWMWRNEEVRGFVDWLRHWNGQKTTRAKAGFHGLDMYSLYRSMDEVLSYLTNRAPELMPLATRQYQCLQPYRDNPVEYARSALHPEFRTCEDDILETLRTLYERQRQLEQNDDERLFDALQNASLVASAEEYYRTLFLAEANAWNLRDSHMFATLESLLDHYGDGSRCIVWAHNSHVGDSDATDMSRRGEYNIGRLARDRFGDELFSIGFGTHSGTVMAASDWGGDNEVKRVRPSMEGSYEQLFHESGLAMAALPLRHGDNQLLQALHPQRLQRAIGVIYRPETERQSHYYHACLPEQFDEYLWLDETRAVTPLETHSLKGMPDTYPFGL